MSQQLERVPLPPTPCNNNPQTAKGRGEGSEPALLQHKRSLKLLPGVGGGELGMAVLAAVHGGLSPCPHQGGQLTQHITWISMLQ